MAFHFSEAACAVLYSLGWSQTRKVDIGDVVASLCRRVYALHGGAARILDSFLGICINAPGAYWIDFTDPAMAGGNFLREQLVELNPTLFADLYPIGHRSLSCLFVNPGGVIFSVDCDRYSWCSFRSIERLVDVTLRVELPAPEEQYKLLRG